MRNQKGQFVKGNTPPNKGGVGFHHSEKTKVIISQHHKGKKKTPRSLEHRRKLSIAKKGRPGSNTGKRWKLSAQARANISVGHRGEKSYSWRGGTTPLVRLIRRCFKNRQWRSDVFERDDYTCVLCGKRGGWIEADHYPKTFSMIFHENKITSLEMALECEEFWNINNGRTLCRKCHNNTKKIWR